MKTDSVVSSASLGEKEAWRQLLRELREAGIPKIVIKEKRAFVVSWFQEAMASGDFDGSDTETLRPATSRTWLPPIASTKRISDSGDNLLKSSKRGKKKRTKKQSAVAQSDIERTNDNSARKRQTVPEKDNRSTSKDRPKATLRPIDRDTQKKPISIAGRTKSISRPSESPRDTRTKSKAISPINTASQASETLSPKNLPIPSETHLASLSPPISTLSSTPETPPSKHTPIPSETLSPVTQTSSPSPLQLPSQPTGTAHTVQMGKVDKKLLMVAAEKGDIKMVLFLLNSDANIMETAKDGSTALHVAARFGKKEVAQLLLDRGADIEAVKSTYRWTALHEAAHYGEKEIVQLLLDRGADIEAMTTNGWTALHHAARYGGKEVVQLLLDRGADMKAMTKEGFTVLHLAACNGGGER